MEKPPKSNLLILITNSFAAMNVIHSGLAKNLAETYNLCILSDLITDSEMAHINAEMGIDMQLLPMVIPGENRLMRSLRIIQKILFGHFCKIGTLRIKLMEKGGFIPWIIRTLCERLSIRFLTKQLLILSRKWLMILSKHPDQHVYLAGFDFQAVISSSPFDIRENGIVNYFKTNGVEGIALLISWDNLTSKGVMNADFDMVLVWNQLMADEYNRFYSIFRNKGRVLVTGIPRFDLYFQDDISENELHLFRRNHGIQSDSKIILFATSSVKHLPSQNYIIEHLLEYAERNAGVVILVRCHPGDHIDRYHRFRSLQSLHFFQPYQDSNQYHGIPPLDFLQSLRVQIQASHVCVQIASTTCLDAAACNKPVISIAYDSVPNVPYHQSVRRFYDYSHQIPLNNLHLDQKVLDKQALFKSLDAVFDPAISKTSDMKALDALLHHCEPKSVPLTTHYIRKWLGC